MEQKNSSSGFASMDSEKQREIARKGGMAAHKKGTAHEFTSDEARNAGRKGGQQVSANRNHMKEIGRLGGKRSAERRRNKTAAEPLAASAEQKPVESDLIDDRDESAEEMAPSAMAHGAVEHEDNEHVQDVRQ